MSLKKWKLVLASLSVALFTACAGSSNDAGSSNTGYTGSNETSSNTTSSYTGYNSNDDESSSAAKPVVQPKPAAPKEVFDERTLKKTQDEAMAANEDNHKLRKEIFDARTKLGLPIQQPASGDEE